jgi:hypothetical protein
MGTKKLKKEKSFWTENGTHRSIKHMDSVLESIESKYQNEWMLAVEQFSKTGLN